MSAHSVNERIVVLQTVCAKAGLLIRKHPSRISFYEGGMMHMNRLLRRHGAVLQSLMMLAAVILVFWTVSTPAVVGVSASKRELPVYCVQQDESKRTISTRLPSDPHL